VRERLVEVAKEAAQQANESGEPVELKPMNAFERKIVHDAVGEAGAVSVSKGEEPKRRIVVNPA
jgi:spoIIIJ-associated protein